MRFNFFLNEKLENQGNLDRNYVRNINKKKKRKNRKIINFYDIDSIK